MKITLTISLILSLLIVGSVRADVPTVEQRLATIESKLGISYGTPIDVPPAQSQVATPVSAATAYQAIFLHVADSVTEKSVIQWITDTGLERRGFNASFVRGEGTIVREIVDGVTVETTAMSWPAAHAAIVLAPGTDVATLKAGTYALQAGNYVLSAECSWTDVTLIGVGSDKTTVTFHNDPAKSWRVIHCTRVAVQGVRFVNDYAYSDKWAINKNPARRECSGAFDCGDDCTFVDVVAVHWNDAWYAAGQRLHRERCAGVELIGNELWAAGGDISSYQCTLDNSRIEHCERGGGWHRWAVNDCDLTNLDPPDPNDEAKGSIVAQVGDRGYFWRNKLHAPPGAGPLPVPSGGKIDERTTHLVYEDNVSDFGIDLWGGLDQFRITGTRINAFWNLDARTVSNGIVPAGTKVPEWAVNIRVAA